jgi:hypothetical protein
MGAAWRDMSGRKRGFERILKMVEGVRFVYFSSSIRSPHCSSFLPSSALDMEVCTTLGMLSPDQAARLKTAGLTAYNHNLDTSREYYPKVGSPSLTYVSVSSRDFVDQPHIHRSSRLASSTSDWRRLRLSGRPASACAAEESLVLVRTMETVSA